MHGYRVRWTDQRPLKRAQRALRVLSRAEPTAICRARPRSRASAARGFRRGPGRARRPTDGSAQRRAASRPRPPRSRARKRRWWPRRPLPTRQARRRMLQPRPHREPGSREMEPGDHGSAAPDPTGLSVKPRGAPGSALALGPVRGANWVTWASTRRQSRSDQGHRKEPLPLERADWRRRRSAS